MMEVMSWAEAVAVAADTAAAVLAADILLAALAAEEDQVEALVVDTAAIQGIVHPIVQDTIEHITMAEDQDLQEDHIVEHL